MAILEGGVRFPVSPLLLNTLRFYGLSPEQLPPNFYRVVSCIDRLNQLYGLELNHHDINYMYSLCGTKTTHYYLKFRDYRVRLISCSTRFKQKLSRGVCPGEWQLVCRWDPLPTFATRSWFILPNRPSYLPFCLLPFVLSTRVLIYYIPLLQTAKNSSRTLGWYM